MPGPVEPLARVCPEIALNVLLEPMTADFLFEDGGLGGRSGAVDGEEPF